MGPNTLSTAQANHLNHAVIDAWNSRDPSNVIPLLNQRAHWMENETVHRGRNEIWAALQTRWINTIHFQVHMQMTALEGNRITVRMESEWQDSLHGQWYRRSGQAAFTFDADCLITRIESQTEHEPISADDRRLRLDTTSSQA